MEVEKFNPYHDRLGRFSSAAGAASFTWAPGKSRAHDLAIEREKKRTAAMDDKKQTGKPKKGLEAGLGVEHAESIEKLVSSAPEDVQKVWEKFGDKVIVGSSNSSKSRFQHSDQKIYVDIEKDSTTKGGKYSHMAYETTLHESGHAIDYWASKQAGLEKFSRDYNGGEFQKTLKAEADAYFKRRQKEMSAAEGRKLTIAEVRKRVAQEFSTMTMADSGDVQDMLEGATEGKFQGWFGHGKTYWTGKKVWWSPNPISKHWVAGEAFAEMFSATTSNPGSLKMIQQIFPQSYGVFEKMMKELAQ